MKLGDICSKIGSGATPRGGKDSYKDSGTAIIRSQNVFDWTFSSSGLAFIDDDQAEALSSVEVKQGDVLLNITGDSVARACIVPSEFLPARVNQHVAIIRANEKANNLFLLAWLQANKDILLKLAASGATRNALTKRMLENLDVNLPPIDVQDKVAAFIDSIQVKITLNTKLNGYLEELLLAQFTALSPNENWTEGRADSYYEIGIGKTPPRKEPEWFSDVKADNHVWLSIKDMGEAGTYSLDSSEYLTDAAVNAKNVRRVPADSVLLSFKLTVGRVKIAGCDMTTNEAIACFTSDDKRKLAYAYPYLRSFDYGKLGSTSSIATAVNSKTVKAMPFAMPGDLELSEFYLSTKPIYEQLLTTAKESRFLAQLRDVLLPKLMSGEIDVSKVDLTQLNSHLA